MRATRPSPATVAPAGLRSDACLDLRTGDSLPPGIAVDTLAAGRYAIHTYRGRPYDGIPEAYRRLFASWLPQSGEEVDDRPCMEIYRNTPLDTKAAKLPTTKRIWPYDIAMDIDTDSNMYIGIGCASDRICASW